MLADVDVISLLPTAKPDEARAFYEQVLGLRFLADDGFALVFEINGRLLRLTKIPGFTPQPFSVIAWHVTSAEETVRTLLDRGVTMERYDMFEQDELGIWTVPGDSARIAWFKDPDGNVLSVVEATGMLA